MATIKPESFGELMFKAIESAFKSEVEANWEEHKKKLIEEIDRNKARDISGIMLSMMKYVQIETSGEKVILIIEDRTNRLK